VDDLLATGGELLKLIGESLGQGAILKSRQELIATARTWLIEHPIRLRHAICDNQAIRALFHSRERESVFHGLCEVLAAMALGIPVGPVDRKKRLA
jgi:hypothetical protein